MLSEVIAKLAKAELPIVSDELPGIVKLVTPVQPLKADEPMAVIEVGILNEVKLVILLNVAVSIEVKLVGIVKLVNPVSLNAYMPIEVNVDGNVTLLIFES